MPSPLHSTATFPGRAFLVAAGLVLVLVPAAVLTGCTSVRAGGFGAGFGQGELQGGQVAEFDRDADFVWRRAKETMAHLSTRVPKFDDDVRDAYGTIEGGSVRVQVTLVAPGRSRMVVQARRYGGESEPLARSVLERIGEEVER